MKACLKWFVQPIRMVWRLE